MSQCRNVGISQGKHAEKRRREKKEKGGELLTGISRRKQSLYIQGGEELEQRKAIDGNLDKGNMSTNTRTWNIQ